MKILIVGNITEDITKAYSWYVKNIYEGCTILGHDVEGVEFRHISTLTLRNTIFEHKPDIIFTHLTFHGHGLSRLEEVMELFKDARQKLGSKVIHFLMDARMIPRYSGDISQSFDCAFVNQTQNLKRFSEFWNIPVYFSQYACQKYKNRARPVDDLKGLGNYLVYTGNTGSYPGCRAKLIEDLQKIIPLRIIITQSPEDLRSRTLELAATAKMILSVSSGYDIAHFLDTRPWQYLGAGAFLIQKVFKNVQDIIPSELYAAFNSFDAEEVKGLYEYWLHGGRKRDVVKQKAFDFMQKYHSCDRRMSDILDVILGKRDKVRIFLKDL